MKTLRASLVIALFALSARAEDLASSAAKLGRDLAAPLAKERGITALSAPAFTETGPGAAGLGARAADLVGKELAGAAKLNLIDRAKLEAIAAEARVQIATGKDVDWPALSKRGGAQAILLGTISETGDKLVLQARVVLIATGKVLASGRAEATAAAPARVAAGGVESKSIEVAMRKLSDSLAGGFSRLPGNARYRRLAVMPFTEIGEEAKKRQVGTIVAAEVATDLKRDHNLLLVERQKLVEVMGELRLQQSGAVDPQQTSEIGKLADAQALVIGTASHLGDHYLVDARVVATETGETLAADSAQVSASGMVALASDAVVLRSRKDAVFRSLLIPGWGQIYNRQPAKGFLIMGSEVALLTGALLFHLSGDKAYSDYTSKTSGADLGSNPTETAQALYDTATSRYRTRNILLFTAGGLWLANIIDAYASGVDGDELLAGGVAWRPRLSTDGSAVYASLRF